MVEEREAEGDTDTRGSPDTQRHTEISEISEIWRDTET